MGNSRHCTPDNETASLNIEHGNNNDYSKPATRHQTLEISRRLLQRSSLSHMCVRVFLLWGQSFKLEGAENAEVMNASDSGTCSSCRFE